MLIICLVYYTYMLFSIYIYRERERELPAGRLVARFVQAVWMYPNSKVALKETVW